MAEIEEVDLGDPLMLAEFSLSELRSFYHEATKHFGSRLAGFEARFKNTSPEDEESDYLVGRIEEVEGFLDLVQNFGLVGVYRTFEMFLRNVVDQQRRAGVISGGTKRYVDDLKDQLKEIGVEMTQPPFQWQQIRKLQKIRNCIAHNEGWLDGERVSDLRGCGLPVQEGQYLRLPEGYFLEALELVDQTCRLVVDRCAEARKR
jgi:hypothetical protein